MVTPLHGVQVSQWLPVGGKRTRLFSVLSNFHPPFDSAIYNLILYYYCRPIVVHGYRSDQNWLTATGSLLLVRPPLTIPLRLRIKALTSDHRQRGDDEANGRN